METAIGIKVASHNFSRQRYNGSLCISGTWNIEGLNAAGDPCARAKADTQMIPARESSDEIARMTITVVFRMFRSP
jgi:hypothetical protein